MEVVGGWQGQGAHFSEVAGEGCGERLGMRRRGRLPAPGGSPCLVFAVARGLPASTGLGLVGTSQRGRPQAPAHLLPGDFNGGRLVPAAWSRGES